MSDTFASRAMHKTKILEFIDQLNALSEINPELPAVLSELKTLLEGASEDSHSNTIIINEDAFNHIRQQLIRILDTYEKITNDSKLLYGILNRMAKAHPINDTDIFDLETPSLRIEDSCSRELWYYASSGHAFPLYELVKCQLNDKFVNPCIGAKCYFNHHDQVMIRKRAARKNITIPSAAADAQQFLQNLHQRFLLRSISLMTELAAEVPSIAKEVFNDLLSRKWYSGIGDFFTYLNENTFTRSLLAANTFLWGAYFTGYTELSAPYVLLTSTALIGTACVATDLVKQLILNIEGAFKTYLCINACIVSLALHIDQNCHPTPFNQLVLNMLIKQQQILGCTLIRWLANGVSILNRWVGNDRIYHLKNRIMEYPAQKTVEIFREKIVKEGDRLKQTAHGKRGKKLIDTAVSFMQDMQQSVEDGLTPNIQSYFSNLVQQFMQLQQLNFQRQMRQAAGTMPQNGPQDAAAAEQDMIRLFQQLQQQLQTGLNHATTTAAQRGEPTDNPIAYLQRMFNEVRAAQLNNQANGAGIDPTNPLNAFWAAFAAAQR